MSVLRLFTIQLDRMFDGCLKNNRDESDRSNCEAHVEEQIILLEQLYLRTPLDDDVADAEQDSQFSGAEAPVREMKRADGVCG